MKNDWVTIRLDEIPNQRTGLHKFTEKICQRWPFCKQCGLIFLRNHITIKAAAKPCIY